MPQPFGGPYLYPLPCDFALPAHNFAVGDPPDGARWVCVNAGFRSGSVVYAEPLGVSTYLVQTVHVRSTFHDVAVTTHHWRWEVAGSPATTDFEAVETALGAFYEAIKTYVTSLVTQREFRWYGPRTEPGPWGEAIRVTPSVLNLGTATAGLPQQIACSVTERTDVRRRWGRFYLPCLGVNSLATDLHGLFLPAFVTAVGNAAETLLGTDIGDFAPVVFGAPTPTSLPVRGIQVDRVPDVQRRRRSAPQSGTHTVTF